MEHLATCKARRNGVCNCGLAEIQTHLQSVHSDQGMTAALNRIGDGLRDIAASMHLYYGLERERYNREYPEKGEVQDAAITHRQTEEERLRESQGDTNESDADWVGRREAGFEANAARKTRKP